MYIECRVLASDVGGVLEIIDNGLTAWILLNEGPSAWAEKITWIISNPKKVLEVIREAAFYAERSFSVNRWASQYAAVFGAVIDRECVERFRSHNV